MRYERSSIYDLHCLWSCYVRLWYFWLVEEIKFVTSAILMQSIFQAECRKDRDTSVRPARLVTKRVKKAGQSRWDDDKQTELARRRAANIPLSLELAVKPPLGYTALVAREHESPPYRCYWRPKPSGIKTSGRATETGKLLRARDCWIANAEQPLNTTGFPKVVSCTRHVYHLPSINLSMTVNLENAPWECGGWLTSNHTPLSPPPPPGQRL